MTLEELYKIIEDRKKKMPKNSYVASLFLQGEDRIIQKIGEEATEVVIAAKNKDKKRIVSEVADLYFHIIVLLNQFDIPITEIYDLLENRKSKQKNV